MAPPLTELRDIQLQLTTHLSTPKGWKAELPGWLTYSGRFTHISGHPSTTGRAQDRESSLAKDQRSTTEPRNQPRTYVRSRVGMIFSCVYIFVCLSVIPRDISKADAARITKLDIEVFYCNSRKLTYFAVKRSYVKVTRQIKTMPAWIAPLWVLASFSTLLFSAVNEGSDYLRLSAVGECVGPWRVGLLRCQVHDNEHAQVGVRVAVQLNGLHIMSADRQWIVVQRCRPRRQRV